MIPTSCSYKNVQKDIPFLQEPIKHVYIQNIIKRANLRITFISFQEKKSICQILLILNPNRPVEDMSIVCLQHLQLKDRQK